MPLESVLLALVVVLAVAVEASLGFGSTVITVALASLWMPLGDIIPAMLPVNLVLSGYLVVRYRRHIAWRFLGTRVLPFMGLGLPVGFWLYAHYAGSGLKTGLGSFIVVLAAFELRKLRRPQLAAAAPGRLAERLALVGAGIAHGAFASGGPLAVWVGGRVLEDKAVFRASLSLLWLVLNLVLIGAFLQQGQLGLSSLRTSALIAPSLALGVVVGEWAHSRIALRPFRVGVYVTLLLVGALLVAKG